MKYIFVDKINNVVTKTMTAYPPIGAHIFMGYKPMCVVTNIILSPNDISDYDQLIDKDTDALVVVQ